MSKITILGVLFSPTPTQPTGVYFQYRVKNILTPQPWLPVHPFNATQILQPNGILNVPAEIPNLLPATEYEVFAQTKCGSLEKIIEVTTPTALCPLINDIEAIVS